MIFVRAEKHKSRYSLNSTTTVERNPPRLDIPDEYSTWIPNSIELLHEAVAALLGLDRQVATRCPTKR